ncbi:MAG: dependent oxidoreductase [Herminiimonas sp.]|nr:dependent oxidoreductase [Herminiimonas sp.]
MKTRFDAIIIGAGPAGSSAAILLALAGWSVAVVEKQSFPRRKVCGECIAAGNLALFDALGIGVEFDAIAGPPLSQVALMSGKLCIAADLPPLAHPRHRWGRALGRERLDTLLLERARQAGATILQPWRAEAIHGGAGAFQCEVRAVGEHGAAMRLTAPVLIAAHGSWERRPRAAPEALPPQRHADLFAFKANFIDAELAAGLLPVLAFDGGYGGIVVAEDGLATLACCIRRDRLRACRSGMPGAQAGEAVERMLKAACGGVRQALSGARRQGSWLGIGPIRPGIRLHAGGGVFLIGNAAGEAHPIIGEGISMAMQSSWLLCERLLGDNAAIRGGGPQQRVQRDYTLAWKRCFATRIRVAAWFAHLAMRPGLASGLLPLLRQWPGVLTQAARISGKTRLAVNPQAIETMLGNQSLSSIHQSALQE